MIKIIFILSLLVLLPLENGYADTTSSLSLWATTFGGDGNFADGMNSVRQTSDGGYIVAGETNSFDSDGGDAWVMKLDKEGVVVWQKTFGGVHYDVAASVMESFAEGASDGYVVAGETYSYGDGYHSDAWVFKLDNDGQIVWQKTYGSELSGSANSIKQTSDGGYIVAGETNSFDAVGGDFWVFKLDKDGNIQWQKSYGGSNSDVAYEVQQTSDGGYIVAGISDYADNDEVSGDASVLKLNKDGVIEWQKSYGGSNYDAAKAIMQTADGGYIVAGETYSFGKEGDAWVFKLDANGVMEWQKSYGGAGYDTANSVQQTLSDGSPDGYIVAGESNSFGTGDGDAWVLKLDTNGGIAWQNTYGSIDHDLANSVQQTADGGYIVAGASIFSEKLSYDAWVLKLDKNGNAGACSSVNASTATANSTSVANEGNNTNMTAADTAADVTSRDDSPFDTDAESVTLCRVQNGIEHKIYILTVAMGSEGTGDGNVTSKEKDGTNRLIDCGSNGTDCKRRFEVKSKTKVTLTAKADADSIFVGWSGEGCSGKANTCTVSITQSRDITALFNLKVLTIKASAGKGGSITPTGITNPTSKTRVNYGSQLKYVIAPNEGFEVAYVKINGKIRDPLLEYTFGPITTNNSITAFFKPKTYNITTTVTPKGAGTISPAGTVKVATGKTKKFTIKVKDKKYKLVRVLVNGEDKGATGSFTFTNVKADQSIEAVFELKK